MDHKEQAVFKGDLDTLTIVTNITESEVTFDLWNVHVSEQPFESQTISIEKFNARLVAKRCRAWNPKYTFTNVTLADLQAKGISHR